MDWTKGFTSSYYMTEVDPITWRDIERFEITGGSIKHESTSLLESADVTLTNYDGAERWVRIYLDTLQGQESAHTALFTGLATSPDRDINGTLETNQLECYSVLKPAEDVLLPRGWYAPAGSVGSAIIKKLLDVVFAPVIEEPLSPTLTTSIIAEDGESNLTMTYKILNAINWRLKISGDGTITICPKATEESARFNTQDFDIIKPQLKASKDWFSCPNVFRAIDDDMMAIARDDSENSPLSTVNRGREIWEEETNCDLADNESLAEYALRRLKELQQVQVVVNYERRFIPNITATDVIRLQLPNIRINGLFQIKSQSIDIGGGSRVTEEVEQWT